MAGRGGLWLFVISEVAICNQQVRGSNHKVLRRKILVLSPRGKTYVVIISVLLAKYFNHGICFDEIHPLPPKRTNRHLLVSSFSSYKWMRFLNLCKINIFLCVIAESVSLTMYFVVNFQQVWYTEKNNCWKRSWLYEQITKTKHLLRKRN